jgi:hypothetical protein
MRVRDHLCHAAVLLAGLLTATGVAGGTEGLSRDAGLIELRIEGGAATAAQFLATQPPTLEYKAYLLDDGDAVCVFNALPNMQYVIACFQADWERKRTDITTWVIDTGGGPEPGPGPGPDPGPGPGPRPDGTAGLVYDIAVKVNRPTDAKAMALNFETVESEIAAGGITKIEDARKRIVELNRDLKLDEVWRPFGEFLRGYMNTNAKTLPTARRAFASIAQGLHAAAG